MPLGDFLVAYLRKAGVTHLFGIPGDLILSLFHKFAGPRGLEIVTLSHEPGVGFAADGYARSTGKMGVLAVTYGAGGHNVVNPVAGSFSEEVPVLVISGGPGERELEPGRLIHHQAKDVESQHRIFREVTCATRVLEHPERAAEEIHDLVQTIQIERRPGYLEIHRDVVDVEISIPARIRQWDGSVPGVKSDPGAVSEAARETVARLNGAKRPIVIAGIEVHREGGGKALVRLAEALEVPVLTTVLSKGVFPMNHPLHFGVYCGRFSPEPIRRRTSASDLLLVLGALPTDLNLGPAPAHPNPGREIWAIGREVRVSRHTYTGVSLTSFLRALLRIGTLRPHEEKVRYVDNLRPPRNETRSPVPINDLLWTINSFLATRRNYHVFAESGDMLFAGLEIRVPSGGLYFAQGFYASMGFGVPGALGAQIGTGKRALVLCGDGAFQMTGTEIAHAPRLGCNPIVVLVNNGGWGIFRPVTPRKELLELPEWPYAEMARGWGGFGARVSTVRELRVSLEEASRDDRFAIIEVLVPPNDLSPITRRYIRASAAAGRRERR